MNRLADNFKTDNFSLNVLVAPMDWGLGHATRCIPVIKLLIAKGCNVVIAAEGSHEIILQQEFPQLTFIHLQGYRIKYARHFLMWRLSAQLFSINRTIQQEHQWLQNAVTIHNIHWIISDNRYGLWHPTVPTTFITHQLRVRLPFIMRWAETLVQKILYGHINHFTSCWVPDLGDENRGLSGKLGHPLKKPLIPLRYIGWLSRFNGVEQPAPTQYSCAIILSGPEPQRSLLEKILLPELKKIEKPVLLVRGLPNATDKPSLPANITVKNHLPASDMQAAFLQSEFIVARCGYSTLMDAFVLQKKCILIPTPGQTEQEYLGEKLRNEKMALVYSQRKFNLQNALNEAAGFTFHFPLNSINNLLEMAIDSFIQENFSELAS